MQTDVKLPWKPFTATATAAPVTVTLAPTTASYRTITHLSASVTVAGSGPVTITVTDGGTVTYLLNVTLAEDTPLILDLGDGLITNPVNTVTVVISATVSTCVGRLNVGVLTVLEG